MQPDDPKTSIDQDHVFAALAHPVRRRILDVLKASPGCNVSDVCGHFEMSRIGVMKHLKVLERAGLVLSEKVGRTRELHFNVVPIQMIYDRWTTELSALWASRLTDLKYRVEAQGENGDNSEIDPDTCS